MQETRQLSPEEGPHYSNTVFYPVPNTRNAHQYPGSDQQICFSSSITKQDNLVAGTALTGLLVKRVFSSFFSSKGNKRRKQMGLHETKKFLHSKGNHQQNE